MQYPIAIEISEGKALGVVFPDVKGCFSAGDTIQDALHNAKGALELHFEALINDGLGLPKPGTVNDYIENPEFKGWVWALVEYTGQS